MAADNKVLGNFDLVDIPPAPRGVPQIEVGFDIDADGIVNVTARDKATGKQQNITIQSSGGHSKEEVEQMVEDAKRHAEEDKTKREQVELRNTADSLIYNTEKSLTEHEAKLSDDDKSACKTAIEEMRTALAGTDADEIKAKTESLQQAAMKIGEAVYKAGSSDTSASEEPPKDEQTVDAEYTEKKDEKKE